MALNVGSIYADFIVDNTKATKSLKDIESSFEKITSNAKSLSNVSTNTFNILADKIDTIKTSIGDFKNSFSLLGETLKNTIAAVILGNFAKLGMQLEQTKISFEVMLGSATKAKQLLQELNQFANFTPFENEEIIQTSKTLLSFGLSVEEVKDSLKFLGDIASGTGNSLQDIGRIFGQISTAGKLTSEDLMQLLDRGVPVLDVLSKRFNTTGDSIRQMISDGKITKDVMVETFKAMTSEGGIFFNMMDKQSQTTAGMFSTFVGTLEDTLSKISLIFSQSFKPLFAILNPIIQIINDVITSFVDWYETLSEGDKMVINIITLISTLIVVLASIAPLINTILIPAITGLATTMATSLVSAFTAINAAMGPIGWIIAAIIGLIVLMIAKWNDIKNVINPLIKMFDRLKAALNLGSIGDKIKEFFGSFSNKGKKNLEDTTKKVSLLTIALQTVLAVISSIGIVFISSFFIVKETLKTLVDLILGLDKLLSAFFSDIIQNAKNVYIKVKSFFSGENYELSIDFNKTKESWENLKNNFETGFYKIVEEAKSMGYAIADTFKEIGKSDSSEKLEETKDKVKKLKNETTDAKESIKNDMKEVATSFQGAGDMITDSLAKVLNYSVRSFEIAVGGFSDSTQQLVNKITSFINGTLQVVNAYFNAFTAIKNAQKESFGRLMDWVNYFYDSQINALENSRKEMQESYDKELKDYRIHLEDMRSEYQNHIDELKLMNNEEYLRRKEELEKQYKMQKLLDEEEFNNRKNRLEESSVDTEQYYVNLQILREDYARLQQEREREFNEALSNLQKEMKDNELNLEIDYNKQKLIESGIYDENKWNLMSEEEKRQAYLNYLKKEELRKEQEINKKKEDEEKRFNEEKRKLEKEKAMISYMASLQQFYADKAMQILQLRIQMITSIAQIYAGLLQAFAAVPFGLGIPVALGLATGLSAMIQGMFANAIGIVSAMPPPPPPVGLQEGGVIGSPEARSGDYIPAMLANNEAVIDKERTNKLFNFIDNANKTNESKTIQINFEQNSIYIQGVVDEELINTISNRITSRIQAVI